MTTKIFRGDFEEFNSESNDFTGLIVEDDSLLKIQIKCKTIQEFVITSNKFEKFVDMITFNSIILRFGIEKYEEMKSWIETMPILFIEEKMIKKELLDLFTNIIIKEDELFNNIY